MSDATATRAAPTRAVPTGSPAAPTRRTRRRVPREVRIPQIAAIAEDLFGRFGYQGTSMDDVARLAGVSKPVVYDLVGSKEELFTLCMARSADELASRVATAVDTTSADASGDDRLRAGALAFFGFVADHRPAWRGLLASGSAPLTAEMAAIRRNQAGLVAGLLIQGESSERLSRRSHSSGPASAKDPVASSVSDQVGAEALANAINGAFEALAGWWQSHESVSAEDLAELMVQLMGPGLETMAGLVAEPASPADLAAGPKGARS